MNSQKSGHYELFQEGEFSWRLWELNEAIKYEKDYLEDRKRESIQERRKVTRKDAIVGTKFG